MRVVKKQKQKKEKMIFCIVVLYFSAREIFVIYFSVWGTRSGILCYIFPSVERALVFCVIFFCLWNAYWYFVLYISACGTRTGIFVLFFCVWNAHWHFVLYVSANGTCSGTLYFIFPLVEHALVFCIIFFRV